MHMKISPKIDCYLDEQGNFVPFVHTETVNLSMERNVYHTNPKYIQIHAWCSQTFDLKDYEIHVNKSGNRMAVQFKHAEDAVQFKLTWDCL